MCPGNDGKYYMKQITGKILTYTTAVAAHAVDPSGGIQALLV